MRGIDLLRSIGQIDDELVEEAAQTGEITQNDKKHQDAYNDTRVTIKKIVHIPIRRLGSAAACLLCLCITGVAAYRIQQSQRIYEEIADAVNETTALETADAKTEIQSSKHDIIQESDSASGRDWSGYEIISEYPESMEDGIYCYAAPSKGSYFYYHDLDEAIKHYEKTDGIYAYDVYIDVLAYYEPDVPGETQSKGNIKGMLTGSDEEGKMLLEEEYQRLLSLGYDVRLSQEHKLSGIFTAYELEHFEAYEDYGYTFRFANEN